jgi:hypothetical protein
MSEPEKSYSFMYNTRYDDGAIVIGRYLHGLPSDFKFVSSCYNSDDWINLGLISINENDLVIQKEVITDLEQYGGGFKFDYYSLFDQDGNDADFDEHPVLLQWFKKHKSSV